VPLIRQLDGFHAKAGRENPVERCRRAAALEVTEHATTRFFACLFSDFVRNNFADSTEPKLAAFYVAFHLFTVFRSRAFRNHNDSSKVTCCLTRFDHPRYIVVIEWNFGNQNDIGAARDAAMQRDSTRVPSHDFDNDDPPVTRRGGMQPVEGVHHHINGRIESERRRRRFEIVVDRLRSPMQLMPASCNCCAVTSEPSPPTMINARTWRSSKIFRASAIIFAGTIVRSPAPTLATK
jgi:hypothetical protein